MKRYPRRLTGFLCLFTTLICLSSVPYAVAESTTRVLILPLTIHSEKDLDFLNHGIMDMMSARISQAAAVIRHNALPEGQTPLQVARDLKVDYVVTGSLTVFGDSASTDAALTTVATGDAAIHFSRFGQRRSDVLKHVDEFAVQVNEHIASLSSRPPVAAPTAPAPPVMAPQTGPTVAAVTPPPPVPAPAAPAASASPAGPAVATAAATDGALWTSRPFKGVVSALTIGDVDGDGRPDVVFVHDDRVVVERFRDNRLERLAAVDAGSRHHVIAVDAGDINGNRVAEIFVTRLNPHGRLDSMVVEWNGTSLATIASEQPWYFRVMNAPQTGRVLMGQRQGVPSGADTGGLYEDSHFLSGVFALTWNGRQYDARTRVPLPGDMTVYRFARGDLCNDGSVRTIAYSPDDELRIYHPSGSAQWAGKETYGGNPLFLENANDEITKNRTYLTQRLIVADLDGDGTNEVVTVHNHDAAKGLVKRFRQYTRGNILALRWNQVNMKTIWTGENIGGYISDFSLADMNGDGRVEAIYAMVASTGLTQSKSSNIVVEQIDGLSE